LPLETDDAKEARVGTGSRGKPLGCLQKGNPGIAVWTKW